MSTFAMHVAKTGLNSQQIKMQVKALWTRPLPADSETRPAEPAEAL